MWERAKSCVFVLEEEESTKGEKTQSLPAVLDKRRKCCLKESTCVFCCNRKRKREEEKTSRKHRKEEKSRERKNKKRKKRHHHSGEKKINYDDIWSLELNTGKHKITFYMDLHPKMKEIILNGLGKLDKKFNEEKTVHTYGDTVNDEINKCKCSKMNKKFVELLQKTLSMRFISRSVSRLKKSEKTDKEKEGTAVSQENMPGTSTEGLVGPATEGEDDEEEADEEVDEEEDFTKNVKTVLQVYTPENFFQKTVLDNIARQLPYESYLAHRPQIGRRKTVTRKLKKKLSKCGEKMREEKIVRVKGVDSLVPTYNVEKKMVPAEHPPGLQLSTFEEEKRKEKRRKKLKKTDKVKRAQD